MKLFSAASRQGSFPNRTLYPVLLAVFAGVLLSTLLAYLYIRDAMEDLALGQTAQALHFLDREVMSRTRELSFLLDLWSHEEVFRLSLDDSRLGVTARAAANRRLSELAGSGAFDRIYLVDAEGTAVAASDPDMVRTVNVADRSFFQRSMQGSPALESFSAGRYSGQPVLVAAAPVHGPDGTGRGVLAATLDIARLSRGLLDGVRIGRTGGAYVLDSQGAVLAVPSWAEPGQFSPGENAARIIAAEGQGRTVQYLSRDVERTAQSLRNPQTGWSLVVEADLAEVLRPAGRVAGLSGAVSLGALFLVLISLGALRRAMASLARSEANFRTIFESAPYSITLSRLEDGVFLDANRTFLDNLGLDREQVVGKTSVDLGILRAEEMEAVSALLARDGRLRNAEATVRHSDGKLHHIIYSAHRVPLGSQDTVLAITADVTGQKEAVMQAFRWRQKFEVIASAAQHVFFDCDLVADAVAWSGSTREVLGYDGDELRGGLARWEGMLHPDDRNPVLERFGEARRECGRFDAEYRLRRRDGEYVYVHEKGVFIPGEDGRAVQVLGVIQDVTGRKQAEMALEASEKKYRAIFNNAPIGIFRSTTDGSFVEANPSLARMLGFPDRESMLAHAADLARDIYPDPAGRARLLGALRTSPAGVSMEVEFRRRDGAPFFAILNAALQRDAAGDSTILDGTIEDITERRRAQDALRQSEEKFSQLFRLSPDSSILVDLDTQKLVDVNDAYLDLFGFVREEVLGRTSQELNVYVDSSRREELYGRLQGDGQVDNFEIEARRKDGSPLIVLLSCRILAIDGAPHMLGVFRNITETKRMQEMMIQTEKMISVGGIAAGIAHEINNPLGIVLQASQNLMQRTRADFPKNREAAEKLGLDLGLLEKYMQARKLDMFLQDIRTAAVRASDIIRHMLDFSRRSESKRKVCDVCDIADKALTLAGSDYDLKKHYDFKRIRIVREYDEGLPAINCTETEIEQVLLNLFRNAAQAMAMADPPVAEPRIAVRVQGLPDRVRIEIEDNGPGMPPEVQRRIFEPFFTTKPLGLGTGLGLSVSYFIVTKGHGGRMAVRSEPGAGTCFSLELPVDETREE
ncbi:MAG: PAS domain S-box protein [Thermodesulfobacteriota bacterium]